MFDFFDQVIGFIESIWQFFLNSINSLIMAVETLARAVYLPLELIAYVPAILGSAITLVVSLSIVKFIVGR